MTLLRSNRCRKRSNKHGLASYLPFCGSRRSKIEVIVGYLMSHRGFAKVFNSLIYLYIIFSEMRLQEMSSMGIGNKPCLDIRPSADQISDRSISVAQLSKSTFDLVQWWSCRLLFNFSVVKNSFYNVSRRR